MSKGNKFTPFIEYYAPDGTILRTELINAET